MHSSFVTILGKTVPITKNPIISEENFQKALECHKFKAWLKNFQSSQVEVKSIDILSLYMFGKNVGFINAEVDAYLNGKKLPGYVFIRGAAVAILLLLNGRMVLTRQFRIPVGKFLIEAPAGMVDESEHFIGVAAKELKEECGIDIECNDMQELGKIIVTPGGSDEEIMLFLVEKTIEQSKLDQIMQQIHGDATEGEQITLDIQDFTWENILKTQDVKLITAAAFYFARRGVQI